MQNSKSYEMNGWKYISVHGSPRERGYSHGYLVAKELEEIQEMMRFIVMHDTGHSWEHYIEICKEKFTPKIMQDFPEIYEEMKGIAEGCNAAGTSITLDEVIAWNNSIVLLGYFYPEKNKNSKNIPNVQKEGGGIEDRCSAFIACGDYTTDGQIVCAHNSFVPFVDGQYYNIILDINPSEGHRILMQTCPGWIWSGTDFFVTSKGIIGTETTIGGFNQFELNNPISCRIRKAMQYGDTLDDYVNILLDKNSGGYANSWLFGDTNTNEIMRFELGLKYHRVSKTKNGYYFGCNVAFDPKIRNLECTNSGYCDIRRHQGARQVRLPDLIDKHKGKINIEVAKKIISDHYDVYLEKQNPCSRTICSHYDLDPREYMSQSDRPKPFQPKGAIDGAVVDSEMAKNMKILMRWGNSCGKKFEPEKFFKQHRQWDYLLPYVKPHGGNSWTEFTIAEEDLTQESLSQPESLTQPETLSSITQPESFSSLTQPESLSSRESLSSLTQPESLSSITQTDNSSKEVASFPPSNNVVLENLKNTVPPSLLKYYTSTNNKTKKNKKQ